MWIGLLVIAAAPCAVKADVVEEYGKYVNTVVAKSFEIAKHAAYENEVRVFVDSASAAQVHLARASEAAVYATACLSSLEKPDLSDPEAVVNELMKTSQAIVFTQEVLRHLDAHRRVEKAVMAMPNEARWEVYRASSLGIPLLHPPDIKVFDGVYLEYATGGNSSSSGGGQGSGSSGGRQQFSSNEMQMALPVIGSIYHIGENISHKNKVDDLWEKLQKEMVQDKHYQQFAKEACAAIVNTHGKQLFEKHRLVADRLSKSFRKVDTGLLKTRCRGLEAALARYERDTVAAIVKKARERAAERFRGEKTKLARQQALGAYYERINLTCLRMEGETVAYGTALALAAEIDADVSLLKLYYPKDGAVMAYVDKTTTRVNRRLAVFEKSTLRGMPKSEVKP
jgi:hypothetical protein